MDTNTLINTLAAFNENPQDDLVHIIDSRLARVAQWMGSEARNLVRLIAVKDTLNGLSEIESGDIESSKIALLKLIDTHEEECLRSFAQIRRATWLYGDNEEMEGARSAAYREPAQNNNTLESSPANDGRTSSQFTTDQYAHPASDMDEVNEPAYSLSPRSSRLESIPEEDEDADDESNYNTSSSDICLTPEPSHKATEKGDEECSVSSSSGGESEDSFVPPQHIFRLQDRGTSIPERYRQLCQEPFGDATYSTSSSDQHEESTIVLTFDCLAFAKEQQKAADDVLGCARKMFEKKLHLSIHCATQSDLLSSSRDDLKDCYSEHLSSLARDIKMETEKLQERLRDLSAESLEHDLLKTDARNIVEAAMRSISLVVNSWYSKFEVSIQAIITANSKWMHELHLLELKAKQPSKKSK